MIGFIVGVLHLGIGLSLVVMMLSCARPEVGGGPGQFVSGLIFMIACRLGILFFYRK